MSAADRTLSLGSATKEWHSLVPIGAGLLMLYGPTVVSLWQTIWQSDDQAHGPIILVVCLWLLWQKRALLLAEGARVAPLAGFGSLVLGLCAYTVGRSQGILIFEIGSMILVLGGALLITRGWACLRALAFPVLFLAFMIPLPGPVVDAITGPLKAGVSNIAESVLYAAGYPIARTGVVLTIGQYQLLVADACSGLNSMFSLSALGLLYLHLMQHASRLRNAILLASILPIAFCANIIRVMVLVLVTYHFGDEAGQGFIHGAAGMLLFVIALMMLFGLDSLLGVILRKKVAAPT